MMAPSLGSDTQSLKSDFRKSQRVEHHLRGSHEKKEPAIPLSLNRNHSSAGERFVAQGEFIRVGAILGSRRRPVSLRKFVRVMHRATADQSPARSRLPRCWLTICGGEVGFDA